MQLRQACVSGERPKSCPHCGHCGLHRHGAYQRHSKADSLADEDQKTILRYLCPRCSRTCSVLPDDILPYRPISAKLTQAWFDAAIRGDTGPPVTEKEGGCLRRAFKRFTERVAPLTAILGQMIRVIKPTAQKLWQALHTFGNLQNILKLLAQKFNTSLLGHYRCLQSG